MLEDAAALVRSLRPDVDVRTHVDGRPAAGTA